MKDTVESLRSEEKELEEKVFGTPATEATTEEAAAEDQTGAEEAPVDEKELVTPDPKPATDEQTEPTREPKEDWEKRYKNLRASRDEKLYKTKSQLAAALETINALQAQINELRTAAPKVDPLDGLFTDEDTDALGEATVEAMRKVTKRATEAATKPLKEQLEEERKLREAEAKRLAEQAKKEAYDIFLSRIQQAVPDWEEINYDPAFMEFMEELDFDGTPRKTYFAEAEAQGNAALIIRYMNDFKAQKEQKTPKKEDKLAKKITPVGDDAGATQPKQGAQKEKISRAFIDKFYDDLSRGRYKGRYSEALAIEKRIDEATMRGDIVM